jgi:aspartate kinase
MVRKVAGKIIDRQNAGDDVVVVASAMGKTTDNLIDELVKPLTDLPDLREYDSLLSTGEQQSVAILAIAVNAMGGKARSLLGFQVPIKTDCAFKDARILDIGTKNIRRLLKQGYVVFVAGFQGCDPDLNITTLGRGGSDTTAVALAAALKADVCEIYSDVDGIFTTDPNIAKRARRLDRISYEELLELSSLGAKVLQIRAVEMAMKNSVPVYCLKTFGPSKGTLVTKGDKDMEDIIVSGVALDKDQCKITISNVPDRPGVAAAIFDPLAEANISLDMIIQNVSEAGYTDISFTVRKEDLARAKKIASDTGRKLGSDRVVTDDKVVKVSVVGLGMRSHAGVASRMFNALAGAGINIQMISTSEIKISCVVDEIFAEAAVRVLHKAFGLHKPRRPRAEKAAPKKPAAKKKKSGAR